MLRRFLISKHNEPPGPRFEWRSREPSGIEGFSDAVIGFVLTLLVVSLEVPRTSDQLLDVMGEFVPFAFTFAVMFSLWYRQFLFFRRFGLEDGVTVGLCGVLLFTVMFFAYPLKFIVTDLVHQFMGRSDLIRLADGTTRPAILPEHRKWLFVYYGAGLSSALGTFALLYAHAWRLRDQLRLSEYERFETRGEIRRSLGNIGFGVMLCLFPAVSSLTETRAIPRPFRVAVIAGYTVLALGAAAWAILDPLLHERRRRRFIAEAARSARATPP